MECSCFSCDVGDFDEIIYTFYDKIIKSKRTRWCNECEREIPAGEAFRSELWDKDNPDGTPSKNFTRHISCRDCDSLCALSDCFAYGEIRNQIQEGIAECDLAVFPFNDLSQLTPAARAWVCEQLERKWEEDEDEDE